MEGHAVEMRGKFSPTTEGWLQLTRHPAGCANLWIYQAGVRPCALLGSMKTTKNSASDFVANKRTATQISLTTTRLDGAKEHEARRSSETGLGSRFRQTAFDP